MTWGRTYWLEVSTELEDRHEFHAAVGLHHLTGNARPYWSATGELLNLRRRGENRLEACGAMHDEIRRHFPELRPIVAMHLADDTGVPMYADDNARYWLGLSLYRPQEPMVPSGAAGELERGTDGLDWNPVALGRMWRVDVDRARELRLRIVNAGNDRTDWLEELAAVVVELTPGWMAEADAGRELLEELGAKWCQPFTPEASS